MAQTIVEDFGLNPEVRGYHLKVTDNGRIEIDVQKGTSITIDADAAKTALDTQSSETNDVGTQDVEGYEASAFEDGQHDVIVERDAKFADMFGSGIMFLHAETEDHIASVTEEDLREAVSALKKAAA